MSNMPTLTEEEPLELFEKGAWVDGFTWRTIVGAVFVGLIMMPGAIYMGLISGVSASGIAQWVTIIIFVEIGRRSFIKMKRQEVIILFWVTSGMLVSGVVFGSGTQIFGGPFCHLIWNQYLAQSPQAAGFGIANEIPSWVVPADRSVLLERTLFHSDWIIPILVVCAVIVITEVVTVAGGYFFYRITNDVERLPYPMAAVNAGAAAALEESSSKTEGWRWRIFSTGAMVGIAYGVVYLLIPTVTGAIATEPIVIIPIPFVDWSIELSQSTFFHAAIFGLSFNLMAVLTGFVLPFPVVLGSFVGCIFCNVILNPILYNYTDILHRWEPGMSLIPTWIVNELDFWISVIMGLSLAVAIFGIIKVIKHFVAKRTARATAWTVEELEDLKGRGTFSLWLTGLIMVAGLICSVVFCHILVPDFPLWILLLFAFVYTPIVFYSATRMAAITGSTAGASFPYIREAACVFSGYKGAAIWFAPVPLFQNVAGAQAFKQLELTRTRFVGFLKAKVTTIIMVVIFSLLFWSLVWRMGRIPSSTYPYVQKMWPFRATSQCLWASSTLASDRLSSDSLPNDFEAMPITPDDATAFITPKDQGYRGYLRDFRDSGGEQVALGEGEGIIALVGVDQPESVLAGFTREEVVAVLIVVPEKLSVAETEGLRSRFTDWPRGRYWISGNRAEQFVSQLLVGEEVRVEYRENFLKGAINGWYIGGGLGAAVILLGAMSLFGAPVGFAYGAFAGAATWPHMVIPTMIGAMVGRYYFAKRIGPRRWKSYAPVLLAGYGCGYGLIGTVATAIALLSKAVSMIVL